MAKGNPDWTRDELILALDLYLKHRANIPNQTSAEIGELSATLNKLAATVGASGEPNFRNANGVYMKLMNLRRLDSNYPGVGLARGSKADEAVWNDFADDASRCHEVAAAIRNALEEGAELDSSDPEQPEMDAPEGRLLTRLHHSRERSRKLVAAKKASVLSTGAQLVCEACGFHFEALYGDRGAGYIVCHHTRPVHELKPGDRTKLSDLALLCANCHSMIHCTRPWLSVADLRAIVAARRT